MRSTLDEKALADYLARQLGHFFPDVDTPRAEIQPYVRSALERLEHCLTRVKDKYVPEAGEPSFSHRHTDQYAMFLYFAGNSVYRSNGNPALGEKLYALNKALHALDVYFEVSLPDIFYLQHPVGTVLGRARYADYFMVYQRCTVGGKDGIYPMFSEGVVMYGGSSVIGNSRVGSNSWFSAGSLVMGQDVPRDSVVFGCSPSITIKPTRKSVTERFFRTIASRVA